MAVMDEAGQDGVFRQDGVLRLSMSDDNAGIQATDLDRMVTALADAAQAPDVRGVVLDLTGGQSLSPALSNVVGGLCRLIEAIPSRSWPVFLERSAAVLGRWLWPPTTDLHKAMCTS